MLAVKKLAEIQKGSETRNQNRKRAPPSDGPALEPSALQDAPPCLEAPEPETRTVRQNTNHKPRQPYPQSTGPPYTPPQTPTKSKPPAAQVPPKNGLDKTPLPRPLPHPATPREPTRKEVQPEPKEVTPQSAVPVSVPTLCLPLDGESTEDCHGDELSKKRAHSLSRCHAQQQEREEDAANANAPRRVSRSNSVRNQSDRKNENRNRPAPAGAQPITLRQKKKGPPPPPPKRSSSAISSSSTNLNESGGSAHTAATGNLLDINYNPARRASAVETGAGGAVETGSAGTVRSIAAMLEMSSIGGGAKGLAMQRSTGCHLQVGGAFNLQCLITEFVTH